MLRLYLDENSIEIGLDEAGRGALAFEVCASAVILPTYIPDEFDNPKDKKLLEQIKDSKKMTKIQRENCAEFIKRFALFYATETASPQEIDEMNILKATMLAMHRAIDKVREQMQAPSSSPIKSINQSNEEESSKKIRILADGDRFYPYYDESTRKIIPFTCIPDGDSLYMNIAAASILSKVHRDHLVEEYCKNNAGISEKYGFLSNKAYGTKKHMDGLKQHGSTIFHRKSFGPIKKILLR